MDPIQPELKKLMNALGKDLKNIFLPHGFTLLVFDYGNNGRMNYLSSANREDMIAAMKEFIAVHEGNIHEGPKQPQ